ncbi:MAG: 4Fe-4S binding protein [Desulfobacterales bacterium]
MSAEDSIYRDLQIHLDKETVGFPTTASGSDIRLVKALFPPDQAEMAALLTHRYESLDIIQQRSEGSGKSIEDIERVLDETVDRGMIGFKEEEGKKQYRNIPLLVGMVEAAAYEPTPEFNAAWGEYVAESSFIKDFLTSAAPQMRTIPVEQSITTEHQIGTYDEIKHIIETTTDPIGIVSCVCRLGAARRGSPCKVTSREETCMVFHEGAVNLVKGGGGRQISKEEALEILRKNGEEGLVLQPSNTKGPDFMCSCCGCCCGILNMHKSMENPVEFWATNFLAAVDPDLCTGCGTCVESCQVNAMTLDDDSSISVVDATRCLGCGNCAKDCPAEAIELQKKATEAIPPIDTEELFEVIVTQKA